MIPLPSSVVWLSNTPFSMWLRLAPYPFPILIMAHVTTIALFGGFIVLGNLRILGYAMNDVPAAEVLRQFRVWKWVGFAGLLITGMLIAISDPIEYYTNIMFWLSWGVLALAGINTLIFHRGAERTIGEWEHAPKAPLPARRWAICSIVLWIALIGVGRAIAFF